MPPGQFERQGDRELSKGDRRAAQRAAFGRVLARAKRRKAALHSFCSLSRPIRVGPRGGGLRVLGEDLVVLGERLVFCSPCRKLIASFRGFHKGTARPNEGS